MVRGGIDAKNKIAESDCVAHSFHPLFQEEIGLRAAREKDRFWRQVDMLATGSAIARDVDRDNALPPVDLPRKGLPLVSSLRLFPANLPPDAFDVEEGHGPNTPIAHSDRIALWTLLPAMLYNYTLRLHELYQACLILRRVGCVDTGLHILSNGRAFSDAAFAEKFVSTSHPDLMLGIPIYSDLSEIHDYVVQADGAFDETIRGVLNLKRFKQKVEIRVVIHKQTYER